MGIRRVVPASIKDYIRLRIVQKRFKTCKIDSSDVSLHAKLGDNVKISKYCFVDDVIMGRYSYIGAFSTIISAEIGAFCSMGERCSIGSWEHPLNRLTTSPCIVREVLGMLDAYSDKPAPAKIGNDVWIGNNVFVKGGTGRQWCSNRR